MMFFVMVVLDRRRNPPRPTPLLTILSHPFTWSHILCTPYSHLLNAIPRQTTPILPFLPSFFPTTLPPQCGFKSPNPGMHLWPTSSYQMLPPLFCQTSKHNDDGNSHILCFQMQSTSNKCNPSFLPTNSGLRPPNPGIHLWPTSSYLMLGMKEANSIHSFRATFFGVKEAEISVKFLAGWTNSMKMRSDASYSNDMDWLTYDSSSGTAANVTKWKKTNKCNPTCLRRNKVENRKPT